jgi:ribonuclease HII
MRTHTDIERALHAAGHALLAGVDEAGRGPLAGPVVAAAVIFAPGTVIEGIDDSKILTAARRETLAVEIRERAVAWGIGLAEHDEIDDVNILEATMRAMRRAVDGLRTRPDFLLVDGNRFHHPALPFRTVVRGDARCFSIAAASVLAKVHRDALMREADRRYPAYGFAQHKGYPTAAHIDAIRHHGRSPIHRLSFHVRGLDGSD